jgi:putative tricarboxylic transport membrane protein
VETALLKVAPTQAAIGPRLFPFLVATGLIVVGALVLREALFGHIAHEQRGIELDWLAVAFVSAGLVAQMLLLEWIGWIPATTLLFVAAARAFGSRRLLIDAVIGVVLTSLAFVIFNYGLGLSLPIGTAIEDLLPAESE